MSDPSDPDLSTPDQDGAADPGYLLTAYADHQLHAEGMRLVEERLGADPRLRARLAEIRLLQGLLRTGLAQPPAPARLDPNITGRLLAQAARPLPAALRPRPPRQWLLAAAIFLTIIGLPLLTMLAILGLPLAKLTETLGRQAAFKDDVQAPPNRIYSVPVAADRPAPNPAAMPSAPPVLEAIEDLEIKGGQDPAIALDRTRSPKTDNEIADERSPPLASARPAEMGATGGFLGKPGPRPNRPAGAGSPPPPSASAGTVSGHVTGKAELADTRAQAKTGGLAYDVTDENEAIAAPGAQPARGESGRKDGFSRLEETAAYNGQVPTPSSPSPSRPAGLAVQPPIAYSRDAASGPPPAREPASSSATFGLQQPALATRGGRPAGAAGANKPVELNVSEADSVAAVSSAELAVGGAEVEGTSAAGERQGHGKKRSSTTPPSGPGSSQAQDLPEATGAYMALGVVSANAPRKPLRGVDGVAAGDAGGMTYDKPVATAAEPSARDADREAAAEALGAGGGILIERQKYVENEKTPVATIEQGERADQGRQHQEQAGKIPEQQLHDVRDLENAIEGFPGPDLSIPEPGDGKNRAQAKTNGMTDEEFAEVIKKVVAPERWTEPGVGISVYRGKMVVSGDAVLQRQVDDLLTTLRMREGRRAGAGGATPLAAGQQAQQAGDGRPGDGQAMVVAVRPNPQGQQDLVMLSRQDGDALAVGDEFRIAHAGLEVVTVRVEMAMNGMLACRVLPETWNGDGRPLQAGDHATRRLRPALERLGGTVTPGDLPTLALALGERVSLTSSGDLASLLREAAGAHLALSASALITDQLDGRAAIRVVASRAQAVLQLVRGAGLQANLGGGALTIDRAQGGLDPTDLHGLERERFRAAFGTVPMTSTREDALSTFALSADTATYDLALAQLSAGRPVDPLAIQPEHFINAMPMDYPVTHGDEAFALYAEAAPSPFAEPAGGAPEAPGEAQRAPWAARTALVAIGAVARPAGPEERRPLHLTLAIDCSGSMAQEGGLARIQLGLSGLIEHLKAEDRVALVAFGDQARVVLPATPGNEHDRLQAAVRALATGGATNVAEGLSLAYQLATESLDAGAESRVVLCTDGGTLAGDGAPAVVARIETYRQRGITLLVLGCGGTAYQAAPLESLASQGGGQHVFLGSDAQARAAFSGRLLPERLAVLGRDAKVQVTWNPERVSHYRLIGFENRRLAHRDFRNDAVAAGQLSSDTQVTALYEVLLVEGASGPLGSAAVRYYDTRRQSQRELSCPLPGSVLAAHASPRLRLLACAGEFAEWLQRGWWSNVHGASGERILAELRRCPLAKARELEVWVLRAQLLQARPQARADGGAPPPGGQAADADR